MTCRPNLQVHLKRFPNFFGHAQIQISHILFVILNPLNGYLVIIHGSSFSIYFRVWMYTSDFNLVNILYSRGFPAHFIDLKNVSTYRTRPSSPVHSCIQERSVVQSMVGPNMPGLNVLFLISLIIHFLYRLDSPWLDIFPLSPIEKKKNLPLGVTRYLF